MARCPAHDDLTPSLSIIETGDGKTLVHCHAGCTQIAVLHALRERGLWHNSAERDQRASRGKPRAQSLLADLQARRRTARAVQIWCVTQPAPKTLAEVYLRSRRITIPLPATLRFHPALKHPDGREWPALVGLVTFGGNNTPIAVHRIFLAHDGRAKAPIGVNKMMLGPCRGGAIRLAPAPAKGPLMVGEGIETSLAAMQATGLPSWAALSTSGMRSLELPEQVRYVTIIADGDAPGVAAARAAATRWGLEGRRVRIACAPDGFDFNDMLRDLDRAVDQIG